MIKKTIFPFDLIPTTVEVTNEHVMIIYRQILGTSQQEMIPVKDIHGVEVNSDILFGELILLHGTPEKKLEINNFWKKDAKELEIEIQKLLDAEENASVA